MWVTHGYGLKWAQFDLLARKLLSYLMRQYAPVEPPAETCRFECLEAGYELREKNLY